MSQPARRLRLTGHEPPDALPAASLLLAMAPPPLLAQDQPAPPRLMRGDISGTVGWVSHQQERRPKLQRLALAVRRQRRRGVVLDRSPQDPGGVRRDDCRLRVLVGADRGGAATADVPDDGEELRVAARQPDPAVPVPAERVGPPIPRRRPRYRPRAVVEAGRSGLLVRPDRRGSRGWHGSRCSTASNPRSRPAPS